MYSKIDCMFWKDNKNKTLTDDQKLLFLYILTCPHKNLLGLFVLPTSYMESDLKWNTKQDRVSDRVWNNLSVLIEKGYVLYDKETEVILIRNYLKYNQLESSKQMKGAVKVLPDIPVTKLENTLISILISFKGNKKSEEFNNGIDTLCNNLSDRLSHTHTNTSNSNSNSNSNSITTTTINSNINNIGVEEVEKSIVVVEENEEKIEEDLVIDFYDKNIDKISDYSKSFIKHAREQGFVDELIIYAMEQAVEQNKKTIAYIKGILKNWKKDNIESVLEAKQNEDLYNQENKNKGQNKEKKSTYKNYNQREYKSEELDNFIANKQ